MNTLKCPYCGDEIPQGMRFCPHCMTAFGEVTELENKPLRKNRKAVITAAALLVCAVIGLCGYIFLLDNDKDNIDIFSSANDLSSETVSDGSSDDTSVGFKEDNFKDHISIGHDGSSDLNDNSNSEIDESSDVPPIRSTDSSSKNVDTNDSSLEDTSRPQSTTDGLTKENFIDLITSYCDSHDTEFFGLSDTSDLNYEENGEIISIDLTDDPGAMIFIDTDKEMEHCELYFRAGQLDSVAHCEEILYVMGEILFGCDLSGKEGSFTMGGYRFSIVSYYMPELFYCEYYVTADRVS